MTQENHIGAIALDHLKRWFAASEDPVLLVTGRDSFESSGAAEIIEPLVRGRAVHRVTIVEPNPRARDIDTHLASLCQDEPEQLIVAVGGGSVIDTAKLIKAFRGTDAPVRDKVLSGMGADNASTAPLLAIPTTAGSGSESTHFATVYADRKKFSCAHPSLLPNACFLIPGLLASLPPHLRAASAMDALCQGIESYWSVRSSTQSRSLAAGAVSTLWRTLHNDPEGSRPQSAEQLARASNLAGQAINLSRTTAAHALSYPLTALHDVRHGQAVSLFLPEILEANAETDDSTCRDPRGSAFVRERTDELCQLMLSDTAADAADKFRRLAESLGLASSMRDLGIVADRTAMAEESRTSDRMGNNPRRISPEAVDLILANIS